LFVVRDAVGGTLTIGGLARLVVIAVFGVVVVGSQAPTSPLPVGDLGNPPPATVQSWLAKVGIGFRPLTGPELALVQVTAGTARRLALAQPPAEYGTAGGKILWTKVGCVFLGYYKEPQIGTQGYVPPELPAYLVEVMGGPVPGFSGANTAVVVLSAETGRAFEMFGSGELVLGTTCGVSP
jgi:hypothetical protein